jgi:hypothetical protein
MLASRTLISFPRKLLTMTAKEIKAAGNMPRLNG